MNWYQLRADLEAAKRLNADLTKLMLGLMERGTTQINCSISEVTLLTSTEVELHKKRIAELAAAALRSDIERMLESRVSLYRELADLKFKIGPEWPPYP